MGFLNIIRAITVRILFACHGLISIWRLYDVTRDHRFWYLATLRCHQGSQVLVFGYYLVRAWCGNGHHRFQKNMAKNGNEVEVYVLGGEAKLGSNNWQMTTWAYNMLRRKWTMKASLLEPRRHHAVCVMDKDIYVIGGFTKYRVITSSVHRYHSDDDRWTVCSELIRPEFAATATSVNHRVYLFKTLDIQSYNPDTNQWMIVTTDVPPAKTPGFTVMSAITVGSKIIIQGGYNNMLYQYEPHLIDQNEAWTYLGPYKDVFGSCAELDGKIYCMGNDCDHMETYDLATQEFGVEMSVSSQLSRSFLVTLPFYKETMQ